MYKHTSVLLKEAIDSLKIRQDGIYVDGTFGYGGHSRLILSKLGKKGRLLAIDRDPQAVDIAKNINDSRFSIMHGLFSTLPSYVHSFGLCGRIDGILFDLGVSSLQLDNAIRGFSFIHDGPLDMRMDPTNGSSAAEWLKEAKEDDIIRVLQNFGEERFAKRIARAIMIRNLSYPITRTQELTKIITTAIPIKNKFKHPATRTFQAIRIFINNELKEIELALKNSLEMLVSGGRISIISFHSLEDRIIKYFLREKSRGPYSPMRLPLTEEKIRKLGRCQLKLVGKLKPSKKEIEENPRARSSILRFAEKI